MKKETCRFIIQTVIAVLSAILTSLGTVSCMRHYEPNFGRANLPTHAATNIRALQANLTIPAKQATSQVHEATIMRALPWGYRAAC